jgi:hypothetical protein
MRAKLLGLALVILAFPLGAEDIGIKVEVDCARADLRITVTRIDSYHLDLREIGDICNKTRKT